AAEAEGVRLVDLVAVVPRSDPVLVAGAVAEARDPPLPDAALAAAGERGGALAPAFEVADDVDAVRVGGPDREVDAQHAAGRRIAPRDVRSEAVVRARVRPFREQVDVDVAES